MAEDHYDKTEDPTPKKLADARKKGFVAKSQDFTISILLTFTIGIIFFSLGPMFTHYAAISRSVLQNLNFIYDSPDVVAYWLNTGLIQIFWMLFPLLIGVLVSAIVINYLQIGFVFSFYPMMPKWKRLNIFNATNYEKNFSGLALVKLTFGLLRINLVTFLSWYIVTKEMFKIYTLSRGSTKDLVLFIAKKCLEVAAAICIVYIMVGILDLLYQRWRYNREMRMTRREVKDEYKQLEGDVTVKSKIRSFMRSLARGDEKTALTYADVVITSQNFLAIAIAYDPTKMPAPVCVSKGAGNRAKYILKLAHQYKVPVVENSNLVKSLFQTIQVNGSVPPEHYERVAWALAEASRSITK